ncbi:hypothetical protein CL617_04610 [archaeon]|nr:hypothetical protein [archaeon]|tara:strand:- start:5625 stop:6356 length:732 start_codon:yes stop_codon:yes gene_type:complete
MITKSTEEIKDIYNNQENIFDSWRDKTNYYKIVIEILYNAMENNISFPTKERKVLDAACGPGRNINAILGAGAKEVTGLDLTPNLLNIAKKRFKNNKNVNFSQHNLEKKLPFEDESFDVVVCCKALPHIKNIDQVLGEFKRILKKNGVMFLDFYSPYSFRRLFAGKNYLTYTRWDSVSKVKSYLEKQNLEIKKIYGQNTFIPNESFLNTFKLFKFFRWLENKFTNSFLNKFSGYYNVIIKKDN